LATKKTAKGKTSGKPRKKTAAKGTSARARAASKEKDAARPVALAVANAALEHKALNVQIIDVRGKVDYSDYVVIMSGRSDRQVSALARNIEETLDARGMRCIGVEGLPHAAWLLMDYGDVIVHIFHEDMRGYYDLETLWMDAARVAVE
jgi:ribosome-associated protein